jgi:predicted dehydrogenase
MGSKSSVENALGARPSAGWKQTGLSAALLGTGSISESHFRSLKRVPNVCVAAVCDRDKPKAEAAAARWGISSVFEDLDEMLAATRPDVVHILLPPGAHTSAALKCLASGAHVLVEKPMGLNQPDCLRVAETAAGRGLHAGVNHNQRWHPAFLRLVDVIRSRQLGRIEQAISCFSVPLRQLSAGQHRAWMFRSPGNILYESGPHPLSQILYLLGPVQRAQCLVSGCRLLNTGVKFYDTWQIALECARGTAQLVMQFGRDCPDLWLHAIGQDGTARADFRRNTLQMSGKTRFSEPLDHLLSRVSEGHQLAMQGVRNFGNYVFGFLGLRPPADAFLAGMANSIGAFYQSLPRTPEGLELHEGVQVADACEKILGAAEAALGEGLTVTP